MGTTSTQDGEPERGAAAGSLDGGDAPSALAAALQQVAARGDADAYRHTVQVTSFGGAGTTALCAHLREAGVDLPRTPGQWPFKHRRRPPAAEEVPPGFRVVYLMGDPRDAVLSVFRRRYQLGHFRGLHEREPDAAERIRLESLETFLEAGVDDFGLADHLQRWRDHHPAYPVLFVRYEHMSDHWAEIADFVGVPEGHPPLPTRPRRSDWRAAPEPLRSQLDALCGELARRIEALPSVELHGGPTRGEHPG